MWFQTFELDFTDQSCIHLSCQLLWTLIRHKFGESEMPLDSTLICVFLQNKNLSRNNLFKDILGNSLIFIAEKLRIPAFQSSRTSFFVFWLSDFLHWWRGCGCRQRSQSQRAGRWASGCRGCMASQCAGSADPPSPSPHCAAPQTHCRGQRTQVQVCLFV